MQELLLLGKSHLSAIINGTKNIKTVPNFFMKKMDKKSNDR